MDGSLRTDLFPVITSSSQATAGNTCCRLPVWLNYYIPRLEPTVTGICSMEKDFPRVQNFAALRNFKTSLNGKDCYFQFWIW